MYMHFIHAMNKNNAMMCRQFYPDRFMQVFLLWRIDRYFYIISGEEVAKNIGTVVIFS